MAPHSSTLAWKIPWMEEPGRLPSMGSHFHVRQGKSVTEKIGQGKRVGWCQVGAGSKGGQEGLSEKVATVRVLSLMQEFLGKESQVCSGDSVAKVDKDGRVFIGRGKELDFYFVG